MTACASPEQQQQRSRRRAPWKPPLETVRTEAKGRCFVAARDLQPGELLLRSLPYAAVPDSASRPSVCAGCLSLSPGGTAPPVTPCRGGCGRAYYCSDACEREDAARGHAPGECAFLRRLFGGPPKPPPLSPPQGGRQPGAKDGQEAPAADGAGIRGLADPLGFGDYTLDYTWLVLRVLTRRFLELQSSHRGGAQVEPHLQQPVFEHVWRLCSNRASFSLEKQREFYSVADVLRRYLEEQLGIRGADDFAHFFPPMETEDSFRPAGAHAAAEVALQRPVSQAELDLLEPLVVLICKEECNSFGLYSFRRQNPGSHRQGYALALYLEPVFFNHSCAPSARQFIAPSRLCSAFRDGGDGGNGGTFSVPRPIDKPALFYALDHVPRGREVTISYVSLTHPAELDRTSRTRHLRNMFFFNCDCPRCNPAEGGRTGTADDAGDGWPAAGMCARFPECCGWYVPCELLQCGDAGDESAAAGCDGRLWVCEVCGDSRAVSQNLGHGQV